MALVFDYTDYKKFFEDTISSMSNGGRGIRRQLADFIGCQIAYISHVFGGHAHFNMEQAEAASRFFGLNSQESDFLLLLLSFNRAGTNELRSSIRRQMDERLKARASLKERLRLSEKLTIDTQALYYSHWSYSAIHMALTIPSMRTRTALANQFGLPLSKVDAVLNFLLDKGLIEKKGTEFFSPNGSLHLPSTSPFIVQHHSNWRMQALSKIHGERDDELHYSGVFSIAEKDIPKVKEIISKALEASLKIVQSSKEESVCALCLDLFRP